MTRVTPTAIAEEFGIDRSVLLRRIERGEIPATRTPGGQWRVDRAVAEDFLRRYIAERSRPADGKRCNVCKETKPLDAFVTATSYTKGVRYRYPSSDCRACRAERKRRDRAPSVEARRALKEEQRKARERDALIERERRAAERAARPRLSKAARIRRQTERQRERRHTDPVYYAALKARRIRRDRAIAGTRVVPVSREAIAERDGWRCGICGRRVTREDWSLDHIVPLSVGGSHTPDNVTLAHRRCNSARGVGRLPVQAPLFP